MRRLLLALCCLALPLAGCDDSPSTPSVDQTTCGPPLAVDLATMTRTPSGLYVRDIAVGTGATAKAGQTVFVHYTLNLPSGQLLDSNQPPETALEFRLGRREVIAGFDEGVTGLRVGGCRQLVVPPSLGYGNQPPPGIPSNATLVFTVFLVGVR